MKSIGLIIFTLFVNLLFAQVPKTISYQGLARDSSGNALANKTIGIKISILENASNQVVYSELQTPSTNKFGNFSLQIGNGTSKTGIFGEVNWANAKNVKLEIDPNGGSNYELNGISPLNSVPFALYAEKVNLKLGKGLVFKGDSLLLTVSSSINQLWGENVNDKSIYYNDGVIIGSNKASNSNSLLSVAGNKPYGIFPDDPREMVVIHNTSTDNSSLSMLNLYSGSSKTSGKLTLLHAGPEYTLSGSEGSNQSIIAGSGTNGLVIAADNTPGKIVFKTGGQLSSNNRGVITNTGNWGIGTQTPTAKLHTLGTVRFESLNNIDTLSRILVSDINGNISYRNALTLTSSNNTWNNSDNLVYLNSSKNVAIGTSSPNNSNAVLSVESSRAYGIFPNDPREMVRIHNTSTDNASLAGLSLFAGNIQNGGIAIVHHGSTYALSGAAYQNLSAIGASGSNGLLLHATNTTGKIELMTAGQSRGVITNTGNWGIGTQSPTAKLHTLGSIRFESLNNMDTLSRVLVSDINGNISYRKASTLTASNNTWNNIGNLVYLNSSKNVAIGTSSPNNSNAVLSVESSRAYGIFPNDPREMVVIHNTSTDNSSLSMLNLYSGSSKTSGKLTLLHAGPEYTLSGSEGSNQSIIAGSGTNGLVIAADNTPGKIVFKTGGQLLSNNRGVITSTGNWGIGTQSPTAKLHVSTGDVYIDDPTKGIVMKASNDQCFRIKVANDGTLNSTLIPCP